MKSPWNFLARLTSRRRQEDPQQVLIGHDSDHKTIEGEVQEGPALPPDSSEVGSRDHGETAAPSAIADASDAAQVAPLPVGGENGEAPETIREPVAETHAQLLQGAASIRSPSAGRNKRAERARTDASKALPEQAIQPAPSAPAPETFFEEMTKLDQEIRNLRSQLASKLALQNDHLRKMLARFDRF